MQSNLFNEHRPGDELIIHSIDDAELLEYPQIIDANQATKLLKTLIADIPWRQENLYLAGKLRAIPRLQCWMGDQTSVYAYSGVKLTPYPWHAAVKSIHNRIAELSGNTFNSVLLNYYRDGQDNVAWHADDEAELGDAPVIASFSLGAERTFEIKQKHQTPAKKYQIRLGHGSLLIMGGMMQQHYLHQLPKEKSLSKARINLSFRNIIAK